MCEQLCSAIIASSIIIRDLQPWAARQHSWTEDTSFAQASIEYVGLCVLLTFTSFILPFFCGLTQQPISIVQIILEVRGWILIN